MEEFMESEHYGIFRAELVTKNVVPGSSGTHFMHMRFKDFLPADLRWLTLITIHGIAVYKVIIQYNKLLAYYTKKQWMGVEGKMLHFYIMFSPTK